jgi:hypothetical protein
MTDGTVQGAQGTQVADGAQGAQGAQGGAQAGATAAGGAAAAPWYQGKVDPTTIGFWQNKGLKIDDPVAVAAGLTKHYQEAERFIGAPPDELIRVPKPNAAEADVRSYWGRIGVPAEPKDYDLSGVKFSDGKELELGYADSVRAALHAGRVPKQYAPDVVKSLVKIEEGKAAAKLAERTAVIQSETEKLDRNWGNRKDINTVIAKTALQRLAQAAGITDKEAVAAWDALGTLGGIGGADAWEMLRIIGSRMGEAPYVSSEQSGMSGTMSAAQAAAEIESLKRDEAFRQRLLKGDTESKRKWDNLHKVRDAHLTMTRVA